MNLYLSNATAQRQQICYRLAEHTKIFERLLRPGEQIPINNLNSEQVDSIVNQLRPYGARDVAEVTKVRTFVGIIYSVDRPIPSDRTGSTFEQNKGALLASGEEMRRQSAVALDDQLQKDNQGEARLLSHGFREETAHDPDPTRQEVRFEGRKPKGGDPLPEAPTGRRRRTA